MKPAGWGSLGVLTEHVGQWRDLGFGPFEAALAQGDGFAPGFAEHYAGQLQRTAASWRSVGLDSPLGLRWHQAGVAAEEAARRRDRGEEP